jgi:hypothetical protein
MKVCRFPRLELELALGSDGEPINPDSVSNDAQIRGVWVNAHGFVAPCLPAYAQGDAHHGAQDESLRQRGVWVGIGVGGGSTRFSCDACAPALAQSKYTGDRLGGWTFSGGLGWAPGKHFQVGGEAVNWMHGLSGDSLPDITLFNLSLRYYPFLRGPWLDAGLGISNYSMVHGSGDPIEPLDKAAPVRADGWGHGYSLGLGFAGPGQSGGLRVSYSWGTIRSLSDPNGAVVATGYHYNALLLEIGGRLFLFHR